MTPDPKLTLAHRLELEAALRQVHREEEARRVRLEARQEMEREVIKAQAAIAAAEDTVFRNLPTPPPEAVKELAAQHPVVAGRRHQLERFEQIFGPARIDQAESVAKAIASESSDASPATSQKQSRRLKHSGGES